MFVFDVVPTNGWFCRAAELRWALVCLQILTPSLLPQGHINSASAVATINHQLCTSVIIGETANVRLLYHEVNEKSFAHNQVATMLWHFRLAPSNIFNAAISWTNPMTTKRVFDPFLAFPTECAPLQAKNRCDRKVHYCLASQMAKYKKQKHVKCSNLSRFCGPMFAARFGCMSMFIVSSCIFDTCRGRNPRETRKQK